MRPTSASITQNKIITSEDITMENLIYEKKTVYKRCDKSIIDAAYAYAEGYKHFLDVAKTERESVTEGIKMAEAQGTSDLRRLRCAS